MGYHSTDHMLRNRRTCPKCNRVQVVTFQSHKTLPKCKYCGAEIPPPETKPPLSKKF